MLVRHLKIRDTLMERWQVKSCHFVFLAHEVKCLHLPPGVDSLLWIHDCGESTLALAVTSCSRSIRWSGSLELELCRARIRD